MESFKRKYHHILKEDKSRKQWRNFDKMVAIMKYQDEIKKAQFEQPEESLDTTFSSVYVDEVAPMFFNEEEYSQNEDDYVKTSSATKLTENANRKKTKKRSAKSDNSDLSIALALEKPKQRRRFWILQEEGVFLDVWQKYVRDLRGDRKKSNVYKDMESELHSQGIQIRCSDIKAKIESFTRKFRKERDSVGSDSKWIHYSKVAELVGALEATKFDQFSENSGSSSYVEDTTSWFNEDLPIYPKTCLKYERSSLDCIKSEPSLKRYKSDAKNSLDYTEDAQDGSQLSDTTNVKPLLALEAEDFVMEILDDDSMEHSSIEQKKLDQTTCKPELTEQFGQFVTKELNMLSDDLLIEAKRKIYNVICIMQMKQLKLNNTNNLI